MSLDHTTISKVRKFHIEFGLLVNMINAQPYIQYVNRRSFQGDKVSQDESDHSFPTRNVV